MRRIRLAVAWAFVAAGWVACCSAPAVLAQPELLQNGSFDSPGLPAGEPARALFAPADPFVTGWTTAPGYDGTYSGSVQYFADRGHDPRGHSVALGYYFGINALRQTIATTPGQDYLASFYLATDPFNGPPALLRVTAATDSADFLAPPGSGDMAAMGWQLRTFRFTAGAGDSTTLWFGNVSGIAAIDSVSVVPVPEPGAAGLIGFSVAAMALARRRGRNWDRDRDRDRGRPLVQGMGNSHRREWRSARGRELARRITRA
jgi:hypothetical protein